MRNRTRITIIGGGVGGYPAAIRAARLGGVVTLIEKNLLGGVCLNRGCIPTKSLLQSGKIVKTIRESETFGIKCGDYRIDFGSVMNRKNAVILKLRSGVETLLASKKIKIIKGTATLIDPSTVQILETREKIKSDKIIIACGSRPGKLKIEGADGPDILDSDRFLEMEDLPKSVAIIGGGVVGVEFAQVLKLLGADVTILEMMENLIPGMDKEISLLLQKSLTEEGIKIFTGANVKSIAHGERQDTVDFTIKENPKKCVAEKIILSVGREPDITLLGLDKIGIASKNGALLVNENMETNITGIYAAGDVVGGVMLAHVATAEGECAARNAMGQKTKMSYKAMPACVYTSPEVASVGLSEEEAMEKFAIQVGLFPFHACGKALILNETYGMVKIIAEKKHGEVLGVHIIGPNATDMIAEAVLGMSLEMTVEELAQAVHPHPTLSEAIMESALSVSEGAIHIP